MDDINETTSTSSTSIKVSDLHSFVSIKNKALPNQMVYQVVQDIIDDQNKSFSSSGTSLMQSFKELTARKWNEITNIPISFSIFVDHCPHMRLLIRTNSNNIISWNTSMSQFYLILSIWYDNMQELPLLFPFTRDFIQIHAINPGKNKIYPDYGSQEWVDKIKNALLNTPLSEIAFHLNEINFKCSFDPIKYFDHLPTSTLPKEDLIQFLSKEQDVFELSLKDINGHLRNENDGLLRMNCNCDVIEIVDVRENIYTSQVPTIKNSILVGKNSASHKSTTINDPIDLDYGLDFGRYILLQPTNSATDDKTKPFNISLYVTPDNYCLINMYTQEMDAILQDLTLIWLVLDYFGMYFKHESFGNPLFQVDTLMKRWKKYKCSDSTTDVRCSGTRDSIDLSTISFSDSDNDDENIVPPNNAIIDEEDVMNLDVRIWFLQPLLILPSSNTDILSSFAVLQSSNPNNNNKDIGGGGGMFYNYKSFQDTFSTQEVCARNLSLHLAQHFFNPSSSNSMPYRGQERNNNSNLTPSTDYYHHRR